MDKIKIAFFDIDGTILEFEHKEITDTEWQWRMDRMN